MDQQQQHEQPPPPPPPQQHNDDDGSSPMMMMDEQQQPQQQPPQQYSASQPQPTTSAEEEEEEDVGEYEQYEDDDEFYEEEEEEEEEDYEEEDFVREYENEEEEEDFVGEYENEEEEKAAKEAIKAKEEEEAKRAKRAKISEAIDARIVLEEEVGSLWIGDLQHWMDEVEKEEVRKLWIGDLQHWMNEDYIHRCFAHTGEVFTSKVIRNKKTNECYGFILFKSHAIAERFLHKFNGTPMPKVVGINFRLNWASLRQEEEEEEDMLEQQEEEEDMLEQKGMCYFKSGVLDRLNAETVNQGGSNSSWEIMLKCWRWAQADETSTPQTLEAAQQVYEIVTVLEMDPLQWNKEGSFANMEKLLDELLGYVGLIDVVKELHSVGGLDLVLNFLSGHHTGFGAKVAKLIGTMDHNNHSSQQLVIKAGGLVRLFNNFFSECDATAMTNTLDAISLLFRNNRPTITAFLEKSCYSNLDYGLRSRYYERRTLNLIRRLVQEHSLDCSRVTELGFHRLMMNLASSVNAEVQKAALGCLLVLIEVEGGGNSDQKVKNDEQLKQVLQELIERISAMSPEDLGAARVERQLVDSLWNACYNEPSSLEEKDLLVLPGEECTCVGSSLFSSAWPSSFCCYSHFSSQFKLHQQAVKSISI